MLGLSSDGVEGGSDMMAQSRRALKPASGRASCSGLGKWQVIGKTSHVA